LTHGVLPAGGLRFAPLFAIPELKRSEEVTGDDGLPTDWDTIAAEVDATFAQQSLGECANSVGCWSFPMLTAVPSRPHAVPPCAERSRSPGPANPAPLMSEADYRESTITTLMQVMSFPRDRAISLLRQHNFDLEEVIARLLP